MCIRDRVEAAKKKEHKKVEKSKPKHKKKRWRNKKNKGYHPRKSRGEK